MRYGQPDVESVDVGVYEVPTDQPEADGTLAWSSTTMVLVEARAGGRSGLGWTYSGAGSATVVKEQLSAVCVGASPMDVPGLNERMARSCRNLGRSGLVACAISAVDVALMGSQGPSVGAAADRPVRPGADQTSRSMAAAALPPTTRPRLGPSSSSGSWVGGSRG